MDDKEDWYTRHKREQRRFDIAIGIGVGVLVIFLLGIAALNAWDVWLNVQAP